MNILIFNQDWFARDFRDAGHDVVVCGFRRDFEVKLEQPLTHVDTIIKSLSRPFSPDVIIVHDESSPIMIGGLEQTEIPTLFYSVDTHHHWELHKYYAHLFDLTLIAQKDYAPVFEESGVPVEWMPLWASRFVEASAEKHHKAAFIGTMNAKLNPERVNFFESLKEKAPIHLGHGEYWRIFPHSDIVINQTVKGDLNFRVFEGMMCGALMLTERSGNGLLDLFEDGQHLVTYEKNNVEEAAQRINDLLSDPQKCRRIAEAGRSEILAKHLSRHRSEFVMQKIKNLKKKQHPMKSFSVMLNGNCLARALEEKDPGIATRSLLNGLKAAEQGLDRKEPMSVEIAFHLTICALKYDKAMGSQAGLELLHRAGDLYPEFNIISLARVRGLLNQGRMVEAQQIADRLSDEDAPTIFNTAEMVVSKLLQGA